MRKGLEMLENFDIDVENIDKIKIIEVGTGIFLLIISFIGTAKAFQKFGFLAVGHFMPNSIPVSAIKPVWEKTFTLVLRMILISFVGGALTTHGVMGIIQQKEKVRKPKVKKGDVKITIGNFTYQMKLLKDEAPKTCEIFKKSLPIEGKVRFHGKEAYFITEIEIGPENQTLNPKKGDVCYYPSSRAISIFFKNSKPAAPCNLFGKILDRKINITEGDRIKFELMT